ncbi:MAG: ligand-binding sensor domain-containing protein [Saprospiraceae bacterium]|jgi:ligand-binding sensor domain-containing protein
MPDLIFSSLTRKFFILLPKCLSSGILLSFFWLLQGNFAFVNSQTYAFQHITEKEGLPSTYLYGILQDKQGYIWLTGESGLLWYNGLVYRKPAIHNELKDEIIRFFNIESDKIWMQDLAGRILFYQNGEVLVLAKMNPYKSFPTTEIYNDLNGDTWISNQEDVYILYKREEDSLVRLYVDNKENQLLSIKVFGQTEEGKTVLLTKSGFYLFSGTESIFKPYKNKETFFDFNYGFSKGGKFYVFAGGNIYQLNLETETFEPYLEEFNGSFKDKVIDYHEDKNGYLWFSTFNGVIKMGEKENGEYEITRHLEGEAMGVIMEDNEGNLWFTTSQNGLFILPSLDVKVINGSGDNQQIRIVKQNKKGQIVLGFDNNRFQVLDESWKVIHDQKLFDQYIRLYDMIFDEHGELYFITSSGYVKFDEDYNLIKKSSALGLKSAAFSPDGTLWATSSNFFGRFVEDGNMEKILNKRAYSLFPVGNNEVWIGTIEGLFLYKDRRCKKIENPGLYYDIRDIVLLENGNMLLATQKNGLIGYQPSADTVLYHLTTQNGLSSNYCSKIVVDEKYIWLGTKKGVNRIDLTDYSIAVIGLDQGLPSNEVNYVYKSNNQIYVATNTGAAVFEDSIELARMPPRLEITGIKINEQDTTIWSAYELEYDKNNIKIEFNAITFKNARQAIYQYKMDGIDKDWVQSKINVAQYPSLNPGNYTFLIKTKTTNSGWSSAQLVNFQIDIPYWRSWWFFLLAGLLVLGVSYLTFSEIGRRKNVVRDLRASQLTALRAQMNPHFLFNALNSIQEFIINKDARSANRYLTRFAKLMRNILNVSGKDRITLNKEIETLDLYLSLEALRLGNSFEYFVEVEENIDKNTMYLPSMLVQPFVENAIKHGLMHRNGSKKLYLRFYIQGESLVCEIEDNGVGRETVGEIRKRNPDIYPSKGISLIDERIRLFNAIFKKSLSVEVIDQEDKDNTPVGTKVILTINSNFKGFSQ